MTKESVESCGSAQQPLLNNQLKLFMLGMVLANVGGNMYGPLLPLYLTELEANVVQVGVFFTLSRIFPLVLQILGGWISDSLGRLRSMALGSLAGLLSYGGLLLAPTWQWVLLSEGLSAMTRSLIRPQFFRLHRRAIIPRHARPRLRHHADHLWRRRGGRSAVGRLVDRSIRV